MLPTDYRWLHGPDRSHLHFRFACVAWVQLDGSFWVLGWHGSEVVGSAASKAQAMRFVERMIEVRGLPFKPRKAKRGGWVDG